MRYTIEQKARTLVNTDPLRRCYDGHHYSSEWRWTEWSVLETGMPASRLEFWQNLNKIAVEGRGEEARREFRLVEENRAVLVTPSEPLNVLGES